MCGIGKELNISKVGTFAAARSLLVHRSFIALHCITFHQFLFVLSALFSFGLSDLSLVLFELSIYSISGFDHPLAGVNTS